MSHHCPNPQRICPLPSWEGQRHLQIMVPPLLIGSRKARAVGFDSAMVGLPVWGAKKRDPSKNIEMHWALA
jgi:hypothetical protein